MRLLIFVLTLGLTSFCYGQKEQAKKSVEEKSIELTEGLKYLSLSEEQFEKVKLIYVKYLNEKDELNSKIKELEKRKKAIKVNRNNMINSVLTPDQKKQLERRKNKKKTKSKKN